MNARGLIGSLEHFALMLPAVVRGVSQDDARWKPDDGNWSILEIVRHLGDEEVEDFRTRLRLTLENPKQDWPSINPPQWAIDRRYNECNLDDALERFVSERNASTKWLHGFRDSDWSKTHTHQKFGSMRAGDLLTAWAAHDALHLRQIAKRMHQLAQRDGGEFSASYAGEWSS